MERLGELMIQHGVCIRAVPEKIRHVYDVCDADKIPVPDGEFVYLPEYNREMYVVYTESELSGKFLVEFVQGTSQSIRFTKKNVFSSLEEIEDFLESLN